MFRKRQDKNSKRKGFTLIELLIVIAIIGIISSVVVFNHRAFSDSIELTNAAYEVALLIREAQSAGSSVRAVEGEIDPYVFPYGIYSRYKEEFILNLPHSNNKIVLFADINEDDFYGNFAGSDFGSFDDCNHEECVSIFEMPESIEIEKVCGIELNYNLLCDEGIGGLSLAFIRPKLDSQFMSFNPGDTEPSGLENVIGAAFCLKSSLDTRKLVEVLKTGQVAVREGAECESQG
jgi:prepilin-type N-terminal cleavage/methylation domain-containing protein